MTTPPFDFRRSAVAVAGLALVVGSLAGCTDEAKATIRPKATTTEATTTTTQPPVTTTLVPMPLAPLTGMAATDANLAVRPALAIKIDNSPPAIPQSGVNSADVVFEIKVEGISRLMAVFQSRDSSKVGPTRSARFSDPDILAVLGQPLFGWSGANEGVLKAVQSSPWIVNVNWGVGGNDRYFRTKDKPAPHNLFTSTSNLYAMARPEQHAPPQLFDYLAAGEANPGSSPLQGWSQSVGTTNSQWVFDDAQKQYVRWQYGKVDKTADEGQVRADNVVVLQTRYDGRSAAPIALSVGSGAAWVLTNGTVVQGTWTRADRTQRFELRGPNGEPLKLTPGRTWIELPEAPPVPMDAGTASGLLASPR